MGLSKIDVWLKDFLVEFRKQCEQLSEEQKSKISNLDNFLPPCQMDILCFKDVNLQYLIVTHDKGRKDGEITVHGPIPTYEAVDKLDSILKDPKWDRELSEKEKKIFIEKKKFRDILEPIFLGIINELRNLPFVKPIPTIIGRKLWLTLDSFIWNIRGSITDLDHIETANKIMEDAKKQAEAAKTEIKPTPTAPPKPAIKGFGTYFYPPIWIGKLPRKTFKGKALGWFAFPKKAFDVKYKGRVVVVKEDGFIAIGEEDIVKATRMLNEIMATGFLLGLPFFAARELEVSDSKIDSSNLNITSFGIRTISLRTQLFYEFSLMKEPVFTGRIEVEKEKLVGLIQQAERISQDPDMADFLVFLLEAHTCLQSSEYMQSFMISWIIIERHMSWLWKKFLREEHITRSRREKLMNPAYWTIDFILETLNLAGRLPPDDYEALMRLKKKRNDIMHEGERVSQHEAERCLKVAKGIVQRRIGLPSLPNTIL